MKKCSAYIFKILVVLACVFAPLSSLYSAEVLPGRKKAFEGFSNDPKKIVIKLKSHLSALLKQFNSASQAWYSLHLILDDQWVERLKSWPEKQNFKDYIMNSQTATFSKISGSSTNGFLAFHRMNEYDRSYLQYADPEQVNYATGMELLADKNDQGQLTTDSDIKVSNLRPLVIAQVEELMGIYHTLFNVMEAVTNIRFELEVFKDQITALEFGKQNGYYIRHLDSESAKTLTQFEDDLDDLFVRVQQFRTQYIIKPELMLGGVIKGVTHATYPTTSEFKFDLLQALNGIKLATPEFSRIQQHFLSTLKVLEGLKERSTLAENYSKDQAPVVVDKVEQLFTKVAKLLTEEHGHLRKFTNRSEDTWTDWYQQNHQRYAELYYQLFEILEYHSKKGSDLYDFQSKNFKLQSKNRELYRSLESLIFGTIKDVKIPKNFHRKGDQVGFTRKLKLRSQIIERMVELHQSSNCDLSLAN